MAELFVVYDEINLADDKDWLAILAEVRSKPERVYVLQGDYDLNHALRLLGNNVLRIEDDAPADSPAGGTDVDLSVLTLVPAPPSTEVEP